MAGQTFPNVGSTRINLRNVYIDHVWPWKRWIWTKSPQESGHTHNFIKRYYWGWWPFLWIPHFCLSSLSSASVQVTIERHRKTIFWTSMNPWILMKSYEYLTYSATQWRVLHRQIRFTKGKSWNRVTVAKCWAHPQPKGFHLFGREFWPTSLAGFWLPHLKDVEVDNAFGSNAPRYHPRLERKKTVMFTSHKHCWP